MPVDELFADNETGQGGKMRNYYTMLIERDEEGWYVGSVPSLPGCHTQGRTIDELVSNMEEAISLYSEEEYATPLEFVGVQRISVL